VLLPETNVQRMSPGSPEPIIFGHDNRRHVVEVVVSSPHTQGGNASLFDDTQIHYGKVSRISQILSLVKIS
jgi:hypothetical protein